jgi:hypothetical protein
MSHIETEPIHAVTALALEGLESWPNGSTREVCEIRWPPSGEVLLEYIAYAKENLINYRILFMSVEPIAELKKTRRECRKTIRLSVRCSSGWKLLTFKLDREVHQRS